ncbi:hypothetical protein [Amycolatopsis sp.]|uniref:hypothetical protein n=1 Tax=Amycolatopsis sp. TaxID=37632 RepID=UPI002D7FD511|nr:hypothetical protein [Amycolatopsis sp.]HET6709271.1 hypothetical protein [Amycolatopsis sp.]
MTDHLTRHDAEDERDLTGREGVHEGYRDETTTDVPGQDRTGDDQTLSTADLASAGRQDADADDTTPVEPGGAGETPAASGGDVETPPLIDEEKVTGFRDRWQNVQTGFVDDPKQAVRQADELVAAVISALATTFAEHKSELESQWQQGEPATEELRIALRRYRSFFDQLLPH